MMIDSRAATNFIGAKAAQTFLIPFWPKPMPDPVETINRLLLLLGLVTQDTIPLEAVVDGYQEIICFDVIHSPFFSSNYWHSLIGAARPMYFLAVEEH